MDVGEALRRRRMVRRFTGEAIDRATADRIAGATARAPTAGNAQGVTVVSIIDPETIAAVALACGEAEHVARGFDPWISTSGQVVALCAEPARYAARYAEADKDPAVLEAIPWWWFDAGAALMAMSLAATAEGLDVGFLGGHRGDGAKTVLGIPDDVLLVGILTIGHRAADRRSASLDRPPRSDVVRSETWDIGPGSVPSAS